MKVLSINAGSSSIKFKLFDGEVVLCDGVYERIGEEMSEVTIKCAEKFEEEVVLQNHKEAVLHLIDKLEKLNICKLDEISGIGHRVVHGGEKFTESVVITDQVIEEIEAVSGLAPLHNPANLTAIKEFMEAVPNAIHVAVFDTSFHQTLEPESYLYSIPYSYYEEYGLRKYGFHGTSYRYITEEASKMLGKPVEELKLIIAHIGNGASMCAVKYGKSIETTMGLTPLAGITMGTRCGDIDPSIPEFLAENAGLTIQEINKIFNKESGLLGISGLSNDRRDLEAAVDNPRAQMALRRQNRQVADFIARYFVSLGGCDCIVFTAGVGENSENLREYVGNKLSVLGVEIDREINKSRPKNTFISTDASSIKVAVISTNEELMMARDVMKLSK